jgi:tripartite-type tricarboxylate transporter receptor subunit TctC
MDMHRRRALSLVAGAAVLPWVSLVPRGARAQSYPSRPVSVVVGFGPGGGADLLTRTVCSWLQARLGQTFIVDNRPGAGTNLATEAVARAAADGYTLLATTTSNLLNGALYEDLKYDFMRDIAPVASISTQPLVFMVGPDVESRTVQQFVALARAQPGRLNIGNTGNGTISHLAAEFFKQQAGIDVVTLPYRGYAPMLVDLLGGRIHAAIDNIPASIEHIRSGKLHALAVTTASRTDVLPGVPTVAETLSGYEAYTVAGIGAPAATPPELIGKLNAEINAGLVDSRLRARLADLGATVLTGTPEDFARLVARETAKWAKVIKASGVRLS